MGSITTGGDHIVTPLLTNLLEPIYNFADLTQCVSTFTYGFAATTEKAIVVNPQIHYVPLRGGETRGASVNSFECVADSWLKKSVTLQVSQNMSIGAAEQDQIPPLALRPIMP